MNKTTLYKYPCTDNNVSCHPIKFTLTLGVYQIELWGAGTSNGGGYTTGILEIKKELTLYAYIGGQEMPYGPSCGIGGYNGGGNSSEIGTFNNFCRQSGGSGATDIRLYEDNLDSRIMVAGGSGGSSGCQMIHIKGGYGGSLIGGDGNYDPNFVTTESPGKGGKQDYSNNGNNPGQFGIGGMASPTSATDCAGAGGGGYWGGGSGYHYEWTGSGGGGSSYISGHEGCIIHSSGLIFHSTYMINGESKMPSPLGGNSTGHYGPGYFRLTRFPILCTFQKCQFFNFIKFSSIFILNFK